MRRPGAGRAWALGSPAPGAEHAAAETVTVKA